MGEATPRGFLSARSSPIASVTTKTPPCQNGYFDRGKVEYEKSYCNDLGNLIPPQSLKTERSKNNETPKLWFLHPCPL